MILLTRDAAIIAAIPVRFTTDTSATERFRIVISSQLVAALTLGSVLDNRATVLANQARVFALSGRLTVVCGA